MTKYGNLGVDPKKKGIEVFNSTSGIYKHSFCSIHPDPLRKGFGFVHHVDSAGSIIVQNYLNFKETGKIEAFRGIAQNTLAMNIGDIFCVGVPLSISFADYVAINPFRVPKEDVLKILAEDWNKQFKMLKRYEIEINLSGGETADLPDIIKTLDVSGTVYATYKLDSVITGEDIKPGDDIIGLPSGGKAKYERAAAGSLMSNGLMLARHSLMKPELAVKYPEIYEKDVEYAGRFGPKDKVEGIKGTIGKELTRPTRIFAPVFKGVIEKFKGDVHGIVYDTGGGNTKCLRIGKNVKYVKNNMPDPPPIFKLIKKEGNVPWREMFNDLNMGVGAEIITSAEVSEEASKFIQREFKIEASKIGECRRARGKNKLRLETRYGNFNFK
jgi:phosphoribosylformylglycinamidine cyclo-ligase